MTMNNVHRDNYLQIHKRGHGRNRIGYPSVELIISKISACKFFFSKIIIPKKKNNNHVYIETYNHWMFGGSWYGMLPPRLLSLISLQILQRQDKNNIDIFVLTLQMIQTQMNFREESKIASDTSTNTM